jgi:SAM-dependent methyltransferase
MRTFLTKWLYRMSYTRFYNVWRYAGTEKPRILDIGCGNNSAMKTKRAFPRAEYWGVDRCDYNNDEDSKKLIDNFLLCDVSTLAFGDLPKEHFHAVILSHVIEHLGNGEEVLGGLSFKIKPAGVIYVEFPAPRTTWYPHLLNLNFRDDESHVRTYNPDEIAALLESRGFEVLKVGTRKNLVRIFLAPFLLARALHAHSGRYSGAFLYDLTGFANYVVARKRPVTLGEK